MSNDDDIEVVQEEAGFRAVLIHDDSTDGAGHPRDADNLGIMWTRHRNYTLGDEAYQKHIEEFGELDQFVNQMLEWHSGEAVTQAVVKHLKRKYEATVVLPLYLYDHSGLSISAGGTNLIAHLVNTSAERRRHFIMDPGGWDTSYVGFIFDSARTREMCGTDLARIEEGLRGEVSEYDSYLTGDVWGVRVEKLQSYVTLPVERTDDGYEVLPPGVADVDDEWDEVESCWGFIGHEYAEQEARSMLAGCLTKPDTEED